MIADWVKTSCSGCGGHGMVSDYTYDGSEFLGAKDCSVCGGNGVLYVSSKDVVAIYPGGPFCGKWPGEYARRKANE